MSPGITSLLTDVLAIRAINSEASLTSVLHHMTQVTFRRLAAWILFPPAHPRLSLTFFFCKRNSHCCSKFVDTFDFYIEKNISSISPSAKAATASSILSELAPASREKPAVMHWGTESSSQALPQSPCQQPQTAMWRSGEMSDQRLQVLAAKSESLQGCTWYHRTWIIQRNGSDISPQACPPFSQAPTHSSSRYCLPSSALENNWSHGTTAKCQAIDKNS